MPGLPADNKMSDKAVGCEPLAKPQRVPCPVEG